MISTKIAKNAMLVGLVQAQYELLPTPEGDFGSLVQVASGPMQAMGAPMPATATAAASSSAMGLGKALPSPSVAHVAEQETVVEAVKKPMTVVSPPLKISVEKERREDPKGSLFTEAEAGCYAKRYADVKAGKAIEYYDQTWSIKGHEAEGRLGECALPLTDYEAQRYLNKFPELQQKFGRGGKKSLDLAKNHWANLGWNDKKFQAAVNYTDAAWKCGDAPNVECKCHGTLWIGAKERLDDDKPIKSWENFREFAHVAKVGIEPGTPTMCNSHSFGKDLLPGKDLSCWCEDKPLYEANICAEDGENCMCDGFVAYGLKYGKDKTPLRFKDTIQ